MGKRIDVFAHVTPPQFFDEMNEVHPTDALRNLYFEQTWNLERRITDMDAHGIDTQVISLANPPIWEGISPEDALSLTQLANDSVRDMADTHPDRLIPIATLPFVTPEYVDEFKRCVDDLGVRGVQIFTNIGGQPIDSDGHLSLYEAAANAGVPVWIHPQFHSWYEWLDEYEIHRTIGWPFDTSVAMMRLVFAGVFERYPDLDIITHHLGGMIPFFIGRISSFFEARVNNPEMYPGFDAPDFSTSVREQFERFYGDTVIGGEKSAFACGRSHFGDDGVVFATDYPFGPDGGRRFMQQAIDVVESLDNRDAKQAIFSENAERLLGMS